VVDKSPLLRRRGEFDPPWIGDAARGVEDFEANNVPPVVEVQYDAGLVLITFNDGRFLEDQGQRIRFGW
jgi:hypothetical protein